MSIFEMANQIKGLNLPLADKIECIRAIIDWGNDKGRNTFAQYSRNPGPQPVGFPDMAQRAKQVVSGEAGKRVGIRDVFDVHD